MRAAALIVVADRGGLRAYRVDETNTRGVHLTLVRAFEIPEPDPEARTDHVVPRSDLPPQESEMNRRICRQLAEEIGRIVRQDAAEDGWSVAAASPIYGELLQFLPKDVQNRLVEHVPLDLVKTPVGELAQHFRSLQPLS